MKKNCRIRKRREFVDIAESGFYFKSRLLVVQSKVNQLDSIRTGFTASKKVGNAVVRNRCKRRMRALADIILNDIGCAGTDYVFIARRDTALAEWGALLEEAVRAVNFLNKKMTAQCVQS